MNICFKELNSKIIVKAWNLISLPLKKEAKYEIRSKSCNIVTNFENKYENCTRDKKLNKIVGRLFIF